MNPPAFLLATILALTTLTIRTAEAKEKASPPMLTQNGKASFYAGKWIGRKTANGEIYRSGDITAAHRSLPFGTKVKVTNLRNGKSVEVRINNRGPFVKGRIIDLSLVPAKTLGMIQSGVVPVRIEVVTPIVAKN